MKKVYVVNTCNPWKEYASFTFVGIFTTRKKLNVVLNKMLKDKIILWSDSECTDKFVNALSDRELNDEIENIFIQSVTLNEVQ